MANGTLSPQASQAVGYKQMISHLTGDLDLETAIEQTKIATRRLAKQQRTWLRRFKARPGTIWISVQDQDIETLAQMLLERLEASG